MYILDMLISAPFAHGSFPIPHNIDEKRTMATHTRIRHHSWLMYSWMRNLQSWRCARLHRQIVDSNARESFVNWWIWRGFFSVAILRRNESTPRLAWRIELFWNAFLAKNTCLYARFRGAWEEKRKRGIWIFCHHHTPHTNRSNTSSVVVHSFILHPSSP